MRSEEGIAGGDLVAEQFQQPYPPEFALQQGQCPAGGEQLEPVDARVGVLAGQADPLV